MSGQHHDDGEDRVESTVEALRREFDASFTLRPRRDHEDTVALLAIRVGDHAAALRVHDTTGVLKLGRVVPVPSRRPELLGLVGVRGAVVPVYSLARAIGRADTDTPRWAVLAGTADRVALAFAAFDGHLHVAAADVRSAAPSISTGAHVAGSVELAGGPRPILDVPSIVRALTAAAIGRGG